MWRPEHWTETDYREKDSIIDDEACLLETHGITLDTH